MLSAFVLWNSMAFRAEEVLYQSTPLSESSFCTDRKDGQKQKLAMSEWSFSLQFIVSIKEIYLKSAKTSLMLMLVY